MKRRALLATLWVCVTAVATFVSWRGVEAVTAQVTDTPTAVIATNQVDAALAPPLGKASRPAVTIPRGPTPTPSSTTTAPTSAGPAPTTTTPPLTVAPAAAAQTGTTPVGTPTPATEPDTIPSSPPTTFAVPGGASDGGHGHHGRGGPPGGYPAGGSPGGGGYPGGYPGGSGGFPGGGSGGQPATFTATGGVATMVCNGSQIHLQSAVPENGYRVSVAQDGPQQVVVWFVQGGQQQPDPQDGVTATCQDGAPVQMTT
jgi:hypothetical protein